MKSVVPGDDVSCRILDDSNLCNAVRLIDFSFVCVDVCRRKMIMMMKTRMTRMSKFSAYNKVERALRFHSTWQFVYSNSLFSSRHQ